MRDRGGGKVRMREGEGGEKGYPGYPIRAPPVSILLIESASARKRETETETEDANDEVTRNERGGDGTAHVGSAFTVNRRYSRPSS